MTQYSIAFKDNLLKLLDNISIISDEKKRCSKQVDFMIGGIKKVKHETLVKKFTKKMDLYFESIVDMNKDQFIQLVIRLTSKFVPQRVIKNHFFNNFNESEEILIWLYVFKITIISLEHRINNDKIDELEKNIDMIRVKIKELDFRLDNIV